ncbi:MAG: hypothetical protein KGL41_03645 [Actinomycetales bacterium]|nr:hypothetical protein [Actinomycetales bacterium]
MIRKFAAIAIAAGVVLGTAGCNMISHVATNDPYAPSDGAQGHIGDLKARNFLLLQDSTKSILIGSLVNSAEAATKASLEYKDAGADKTTEVNLNGYQKFDLGYNGTAALPVVTDLKPGALFKLTLRSNGEAVEISVPVLDGTLKEYKAILDATN